MTPDELDEARKIASGLFAVTDLIVEYYEHEAIRMYPKLIRCIDDQAAEIKRLQAMNPFRADVPIGIRIAENHFAYSDGEGSAMIASGLNLLREKDPETYNAYRSLPNRHLMEGTAVPMAWLQRVLQEAISSRGWDFTISTLKYKNRCIARIDMIEENKTVQYGDSPAETLLRCYLEAIIC